MTESLTTDPNQAVDRCWAAYRQAVTEDMAAGSSKASAEYNATLKPCAGRPLQTRRSRR